MAVAMREEFAKNNFFVEDDAVAEQCAAMCVTFGMKPADFVSNWEVFYLNRQMDGGQVSGSCMNGFKQFLEEEKNEALRQQQQDNSGFHTYTSTHLEMLLEDEYDELVHQITPPHLVSKSSNRFSAIANDAVNRSLDADLASLAPKTPATGYAVEAPRPSHEESPITPFGRRIKGCPVQLTFNENLKEPSTESVAAGREDDVLRRLPAVERCKVEVLSSYPKSGCRFMYDRVEDRFFALERRIKRFAESLASTGQTKVSHNVAVAAQGQITVVGRICLDGEGHLNDKSVLLEGSVEFSGGQRVRLDLHNVPQFSLFPGQVIGVEGLNPSGHCLVASRLIQSIPLSVAYEKPEQFEPPPKRHEGSYVKQESDSSVSRRPITIVMAAGPYTASDNLLFEPLNALFTFARRKRPMLLLLMGPFVDSEQALIRKGLVDMTFERIFHDTVGKLVADYCQELGDGARVLLVPSCRDAHHDCVFPQPPFSKKNFDDPEDQIATLANPSIVMCDEVSVGICTVDVLRHLSSEELPRCPVGSDRMTRLASHIIAQRSLYPLFPAPLGTPLDLSMVPEALSLSQVPDILILPSDLAPFVKVLPGPSPSKSEASIEDTMEECLPKDAPSSVLCINPGRLTKGCSGGTFSEVLILPDSRQPDDVSLLDPPCTPLTNRTRVLIKRV